MMISFTAIIQKFEKQGEKTGWTYIGIPETVTEKLFPGNKKSFRVKGFLDTHAIRQVAILPMGNGSFIMALNATMRKGIGKRKGASVAVQLEKDNYVKPLSNDFMQCLSDEPKAMQFFKSLAPSHQKYFSNWIETAKTEITKTKRIALAVNALARKMDFGQMIREDKANRDAMK